MLHKFIPKAVISNLTMLSDKEIGFNIQHCIVMFCSLEPQSDLRAACSEILFYRLNALFSKFDDAVQRSGMFKYQHVGEWYIVACPRAANPFDASPDARNQRYAVEMLALAEELKRITLTNQLWSAARFWLKVGVASGPAAGVVIGLHRRFYCLYGDTVNMASRMCKLAGERVHCDAAFAAELRRAGPAAAACESRGETDVKGKGRLETFEVAAGPRRPAPAQERQSPPAPGRPCQTSMRQLRIAMDDLSPENRRWAADGAGGGSGADLPAEFERFHADGRRRRLAFSVLLHLVAVSTQLANCFLPEQPYGFPPGGAGALALRRLRVVLGVHAALSWCWGAALIAAATRQPRRNLLWRRHFVALKLAHLAFSLAGVACFPGLVTWLGSYSAAQTLLSGWLAPVGARKNAVLVAASLLTVVASAAAAGILRELQVLQAYMVLGVGSLLLSRRHERRERFLWSLHRAMADELALLQRRLMDLVPTPVADRLGRAGAARSCEACSAAVLQLDVCGFTAMSQEMAPMEVPRPPRL